MVCTSALVELENVRARLGRDFMLRDVTLRVGRGEVLGLVGPNGAGKSTLLRVMAGLLAPEGGQVSRSVKPRGGIGYLPQDGEVHWPVTVRHLVSLGRLPHLSPFGKPGPSDAAAIDAALAATSVSHLAGRTVAEVSGGERARIHLARVLAGMPDLILADEPVAGLDPRHQLEVMALFRAEAAGGRGVVMVMHDLALAARFCDRLVLVDRGRVVAEGTPAEVLTNDRMTAVYGVRSVTVTVEGQRYVLPWSLPDRPGASEQAVTGAGHEG